MIEIRMHDGKWRITVKDETLSFDSYEQLNACLNTLLVFKDKYGRIFEEGRK